MVLDQIQDVKMLNTIEERIEILSRCGIDHVIVYPFSKEFSQLTASEYIEGILLEKIKAQKIIIGYDHRFGKNREAGIETLLDFKKKYPALEVIEIPVQLLNSTAVSSTKTRQALQEGNVSLANEFFGLCLYAQRNGCSRKRYRQNLGLSYGQFTYRRELQTHTRKRYLRRTMRN